MSTFHRLAAPDAPLSAPCWEGTGRVSREDKERCKKDVGPDPEDDMGTCTARGSHFQALDQGLASYRMELLMGAHRVKHR